MSGRLATPWEVRLARLLPVSSLIMGVLVFAVLAGTYLVARWLLDIPWWVEDETHGWTLTSSGRLSLVLSLLVGYCVAVAGYGPLALDRDLRALGLVAPDADPEDTIRISPQELRASRIAGWIGVAFATGVATWVNALLGGSIADFLAMFRSFSEGGILCMTLLIGWMVGRGAHAMLIERPSLADVPVDLMNLRRLRPIGRMALRDAGVWIVGGSILSLAFLNREYDLPQLLMAFAPVFSSILVVVLLALLLPSRSIQTRIRQAKETELEQVDAELARVRKAALGGEAASQERLAGLLAYRAYVDGLPEWPFDTGVRIRFLLFLLVPIGSWFGGAFVERLVSRFLD